MYVRYSRGVVFRYNWLIYKRNQININLILKLIFLKINISCGVLYLYPFIVFGDVILSKKKKKKTSCEARTRTAFIFPPIMHADEFGIIF